MQPPDLCIEVALWDRFGWGPEQTRSMTFKELRQLFIVLEQQRVSRDAVENLGKPTVERAEMIVAERKAAAEAQRNRIMQAPDGLVRHPSELRQE